MQIIFCRSHKIGSVAIRALTWSTWSHVAIVHGDMVIEAVWPKVRLSPLADVIASHSAYEIRDFPCSNPDGVIAAALSQVGKPYDWPALFGFLFRRDWQDYKSWFCSELVAWAFAVAGCPLFRAEFLQRITPNHIAMLPSERFPDGHS